MKNSESGSIYVEDGIIVYTSDTYRTWETAASEILLIGEYTNQNGPFMDDYFIAFVINPNEMWYEASFYCEGKDDLIKFLNRYFGHKFEHQLCDSTDFKSRIMWPKELENRPMFDFIDEGFFKLRNRQTLSKEIKEKLTKRLNK